ncbi:MAG: hypothetical protein JXA97_13240 [Anaerolineales bacterium]|nr:hypothetical protein [Anaerolineales bacterium]
MSTARSTIHPHSVSAFFTVFRSLFTLIDENQRELVPAGIRLTYDERFSDPFPAGYADLFTGGDSPKTAATLSS